MDSENRPIPRRRRRVHVTRVADFARRNIAVVVRRITTYKILSSIICTITTIGFIRERSYRRHGGVGQRELLLFYPVNFDDRHESSDQQQQQQQQRQQERQQHKNRV